MGVWWWPLVLVGFVAGRSVGLAPWVVALAADAVLVVVTRWVPWRAVPWGTALVAAALGRAGRRRRRPPRRRAG